MSSRARKRIEKEAAHVGSATELHRALTLAMTVQVGALKGLGCPFEDPHDILEWGARHGGLVAICEVAGARLHAADDLARRAGYCPICYQLPGVCKCIVTPDGMIPAPSSSPGGIIIQS